MDFVPQTYPKTETFRERSIRLLQEKSARDGTRKLSQRSIATDPLCPHTKLLAACFGSVEEAVRAAGLYPARANKKDAIRSLREFYEEMGRSPRTIEAFPLLPYSRNTYERLFGSWNAALKAAGLPIIEANGGKEKATIDGEAIAEAVDMIRQLYGATGFLPPTSEHNRQHPECNSGYFIRLVGKWSRLAELSGLKLQSNQPTKTFNTTPPQFDQAAH